MANTLIPIQTYTLTSTTASVTFSNIPQNYTDLKIAVSARTGRADNGDYILLSFNGAEGNSGQKVWGYGTTVSSDTAVNNVLIVTGNSTTASTFGNLEVYCPNYTSSTGKPVLVDSSAEDNATSSQGNQIGTILWSSGSASTSAVTSITLAGRFSSFLSGSTFTLYGISNGVKATGGTVTVAGGYAYHTFTSTGSFLPNQKITNVDYLVVAGGGGGARINGGGGAGGLRCTVDATGGGGGLENKLTLTAGTSYTVVVGSGGSGNASAGGGQPGGNGSDSFFGRVQSYGGGGGGSYVPSSGYSVSTGNGAAGGSGGGGGFSEIVGTTNGGSVLASGQGFAGGNGSQYKSGGGGGAGAAGSSGSSGQPGGNGGIGVSINSFGLATGTGHSTGGGSYYYAGGGGAGDEDYNLSSGAGGYGGGGNGANRTGSSTRSAGSAGTANTGGGGGGGENGGTGGYNGGSGIVIVRYPIS